MDNKNFKKKTDGVQFQESDSFEAIVQNIIQDEASFIFDIKNKEEEIKQLRDEYYKHIHGKYKKEELSDLTLLLINSFRLGHTIEHFMYFIENYYIPIYKGKEKPEVI